MFENVLVGVDGRAGGRDAIALASHLIDRDGKLTLVHVHSGGVRLTHPITAGLAQEEREAAGALLERERERAGAELPAAELLPVAAPSPGRGLHEQAEQLRADLLVVGSTSQGAFGRARLADHTRAALNGAPCAVAIAPLGYAEHPTPIAKIGVAYNGTPESEAALEMARSLAAATRASIDALEVVTIPTASYGGLAGPALGDTINVMIDEANGRMKALQGVEGRAVYGLAGEELAAFGGEVDLLIVGSRGYGPVKRLVLGSTSDFLERHARCALLVLPRGVAERGSAGERRDAEAIAHARS